MMSDDEKILLQQDGEYRFESGVVSEQAYAHDKSRRAAENRNGEGGGGSKRSSYNTDASAASLETGTAIVSRLSGATNLLSLFKINNLKIFVKDYLWCKLIQEQLIGRVRAIHSLKDLLQSKIIRIILLLISILMLYGAMQLWEIYQRRDVGSQVTEPTTVTAPNDVLNLGNMDANSVRLPAVAESRVATNANGGDAAVDARVSVLERAAEYSLSELATLKQDSALKQQQTKEMRQLLLNMNEVWQQALQTAQNAMRVRQRFNYVVYGISANRAWLQDQRGAMVSVKVGSWLPGYGRVLKIKTKPGLVITENAVIYLDEKSL